MTISERLSGLLHTSDEVHIHFSCVNSMLTPVTGNQQGVDAATTTAAPTAPQGPPPTGGQAPGGVFHSNENAAHEKGESAQREAQETAGKFPTVP